MKIYMPHSRAFDFENEWYKPIRASVLNDIHEITFPHEREGDFDSKKTIVEADVLVAEVSFASTGLGIELGWADNMDKQIVCAYKSGIAISSSIASVCFNVISYSDISDLVAQL